MSKGFTLMEILIVVLILAIVALGIMALLPSGYHQITTAGRMSAMNHLGYEKLDELKARGFSHADLTAGPHPPDALKRLDAQPGYSEFKGYSLTWFVADSDPFAGVKRVTVEVGYMLLKPDGSGELPDTKFQMRQKFVTYIAQ